MISHVPSTSGLACAQDCIRAREQTAKQSFNVHHILTVWLLLQRFGLGFNSVYNLTDVPMFVSGDYAVMFDPHCRYLPGISPAQPGLKISFQHADLLSQFPDAFRPFLHFGCSLRSHYDGTLFRFPLR